jgi:hypothetical protein
VISVSVRSLVSLAALAVLGVSLPACNLVLGINEPEELPWSTVRIYPSDAPLADAPLSDGAGDMEAGIADANADATGARDVSAFDARDANVVNADAAVEAGPRCSNVPVPEGTVCGAGCGLLCPLGRACLRNGDCSSGRCYGARCTLLTCTNGMRDGQESDTDCGGLCTACGASRACRLNTDCASRTCTNGSCQAVLADASADTRPTADVGATPDAPLSDAIVRLDMASDGSSSEGGGDAGREEEDSGDGRTSNDATSFGTRRDDGCVNPQSSCNTTATGSE